jgi:hypothetical protein
MSSRNITLSATHAANNLFKEMYGSGDDQSLVNKKTPLASVLLKNKKADWVGDQFVQPVRFGSGVGLGYRSAGQNLPAPVSAPRGRAIFQAKRAYATAEYDREAIVASRNDKGAFAKVTVDETEATVEGFNLHMIERALFGDASGKLAEVSSKTGSGTTADPWVVTMATNGTNAPVFKKRFFPKGAKIDFYTSGGTYQLTAEVVGTSSTTVSFVLLETGSTTSPTASDLCYWEGNRNGECVGLASIAPASAGTLYGIDQSLNPEFKGIVTDLSAATLVYADINDIVGDLEEELGGSPKLAIGSHNTLSALKSQAEELKRYSAVEVKSSDGRIGFKGLEIMSDEGPFPMIASQMCQDTDLWFIDPAYLQMILRQDFGWFDDDGSILMRDPNKDVYNARYGGYFELFCSKPNSVGRLKNFVV